MNGQIPALVNLPFLQCSASAIDGQRLAPALREISQSSDFNREFRRPKISQRCCPFGLAGVAQAPYLDCSAAEMLRRPPWAFPP
jgi:hypothetical protein